MPTYARLPRFDADYERLSPDEKRRFLEAVKKLVTHLEEPGGRAPGLRIKGVQGAPGVLELTWAPNARATFQFGEPMRESETHVIWRRVGGHEIFGEP